MDGEGYVEVDGGRVFYRRVRRGAGIPLLCLHGGPGFAHDYLRPLEGLADDREVVFYDQLGCGRSDRPADESLWRVERFVREVGLLREALGLDRIHLLGHSWGACLAATYALDRVDGIASLVLASPLISVPRWLEDAGVLRARLPKRVRDVLARHEAAGGTGCPEYVAATLAFYRGHLCRLDPWPEELERTWAGLGGNVYLSMWGPTEFHATGTLRGYDLTPRLGQLGVPTLFTCGRHDEATPEAVESFADLVPQAEVVVFEESSHTPHLEEAGPYLDAVAGFLRRMEP